MCMVGMREGDAVRQGKRFCEKIEKKVAEASSPANAAHVNDASPQQLQVIPRAVHENTLAVLVAICAMRVLNSSPVSSLSHRNVP